MPCVEMCGQLWLETGGFEGQCSECGKEAEEQQLELFGGKDERNQDV